MIIGNGLIANAFKETGKDDELLIFASGVSNSNEVSSAEYQREENLLLSVIGEFPDKIIIYFSSCDVGNNVEHIKYYAHKINMENIVKKGVNSFYIFRLPQVVGINDNRNTLLNYLFFKIQDNAHFDIWANAGRRLIGIDDAVSIVTNIVNNNAHLNSTFNVAALVQYSVLDVVGAIEKFLNKKAVYNLRDKGSAAVLDLSLVSSIVQDLGIDFYDHYLERLLVRYYSHRK